MAFKLDIGKMLDDLRLLWCDTCRTGYTLGAYWKPGGRCGDMSQGQGEPCRGTLRLIEMVPERFRWLRERKRRATVGARRSAKMAGAGR